MNYIYIDANIYLKFYLGNKLFKVLESLVENKERVIVTKQIADEVLRNSLSVNLENLTNTVNNLKWQKPTIPYKNASVATLDLINKVYQQFKDLKGQVETDLAQHLNQVSKQSDEVSLKMRDLFKTALKPNAEEEKQADNLKKYGNPPGKRGDPIGDELNWVQVLNQIKENDKLIIVTNDRDYAKEFNNKYFLNPKLHSDLQAKGVEYYIFSEIIEGLNKLKELQYQEELKFDATDYPSPEDQEQIRIEEKKITVENAIIKCPHNRVTIRPNGIYDEYLCLDCNTIVFRQISDDID
ncbi:MAG TPA: PIN domain-containing protein [Ferruginibacter sp.]|nr:PIN domain-containing protein [Ferruginibacter sp.]